jgi:flavodoxin
MKTAIISYSLTGNNEALACRIATDIKGDHIRVKESKSRSTGRIVGDMIFGRKPKVQPGIEVMKDYDTFIFVGPVWLGQAASPLRSYLDAIKAKAARYAYVSISGGTMDANPKLAGDLKKRTGREPEILIDLHIADLLPKEPKPGIKDTISYHVSSEELERLAGTKLTELKQKLTVNQ